MSSLFFIDNNTRRVNPKFGIFMGIFLGAGFIRPEKEKRRIDVLVLAMTMIQGEHFVGICKLEM